MAASGFVFNWVWFLGKMVQFAACVYIVTNIAKNMKRSSASLTIEKNAKKGIMNSIIGVKYSYDRWKGACELCSYSKSVF